MGLPEMNLEIEAKQRLQMPLIFNRNGSTYYLFCKRMMDIIGALFGILLCIPLFIIIAIAIKLEDPKGPVFFKQTRVGKDGKKFVMYKFRSMVSNAEELLNSILHLNEISGAMFKVKQDPRVTRIGQFIRKTSIDELPQLWNVLRGEMSIVGPRPPLPKEVVKYTPYEEQRLLIMPGCTGLWQVSGRNSVGFEEMVEMDLTYISRRGVIFDLIIIFKTFAVLFGSKAY